VARALIKAREGDTVTLKTPGGEEALEILEVRYEAIPMAASRRRKARGRPTPDPSGRRRGARAGAALAAPASAQSYLWEVMSLSNRVYLYGTVHAGKKEWFPLDRAIEDAFVDSQVLVVEADITDVKKMAGAGKGMTYEPAGHAQEPRRRGRLRAFPEAPAAFPPRRAQRRADEALHGGIAPRLQRMGARRIPSRAERRCVPAAQGQGGDQAHRGDRGHRPADCC
jgi:hypothetical protein